MKVEKLIDLVQLDEMANANQKYTGMAGILYFSTKYELKNQQAHSLGRVKLLRGGQAVSVSIKKSSDGNRKIIGTDKKMIKDLINFVELNEDLLWEYWNTKLEETDSIGTALQFKKIKG